MQDSRLGLFRRRRLLATPLCGRGDRWAPRSPRGRVHTLGWLGPKSPFFAGTKDGGVGALEVDLEVEGDGFFRNGTDLYFVRKALVFLCARGGKLVVTELDRLPPESTEVEDPGVVGLAAADLVDVYVAARECG